MKKRFISIITRLLGVSIKIDGIPFGAKDLRTTESKENA
jgi:hypothetical protein